MKKKVRSIVAVTLLLLLLVTAWLLLGSNTSFEGKYKYLYISSRLPAKEQLLAQMKNDSLIRFNWVFETVANSVGYFDNIKAGKYKINQGMSVVKMVRMLSKGRQEEVRLVLGKMRSRQDLAGKLSHYIESDSLMVLSFVSNPDSLASLGVNADTWMTVVLPNTYNIRWTHTTGFVLRKLQGETKKWWQRNNRMQKAEKQGFSPNEIYTIASIVEEETNMRADKPLVASVYMNRLRKGMPLQADPTVRFAMQNFELNRITFAHLRTSSPYNTYLNKGLPPGPICVPSLATIDSVLNAPSTQYLFFVAKPDFSGYSVFNSNFSDHSKAAKQYQDSLTAWLHRKAAREQAAAN